MAYIVTIIYDDGEKEKIEDVNDVSFVHEYMILCKIDLRVRLVKKLKYIAEYKIVEQPIKKAKL